MPLPSDFNPKVYRTFSPEKLNALCTAAARYALMQTQEKEGHLVSSLAVTELTLALHYIFNTPEDILIWDVGHQAYLHKILTDRAPIFTSNRKKDGLSGFTSRIESPFDPFGAGHSSTCISAIGGFAEAARLQEISRKHIAVIGDGALTGGMAYEALNYLGTTGLDILLILNDNESSIDPNVGALHEFQSYEELFQSLGWGYSGPINGHSLPDLIKQLTREKDASGTRVLHIKTKKKSLVSWKEELGISAAPTLNPTNTLQKTYQDIFTDQLIALAKQDERIVAITPAMLSGSSLNRFKEIFPQRTFDVGIAEQHAVTFAAGLAASGMKPIVHLYSTFAQRAYDQIIHDVALQTLPVVFALDRAGLVGEDGATHHGAFDLSFLNPIPNLQILAPMTGAELERMLDYAFSQNGPVSIRFPRGSEEVFRGEDLPVEPGSFRELKKGEKLCVVSLGTIGVRVENALETLDEKNLGHIDLRFLKPWNDEALKEALAPYEHIITAEEGSLRGGLHDAMATWLAQHLPTKKLTGIGLQDKFVSHGSVSELEDDMGMSTSAIKQLLRKFI